MRPRNFDKSPKRVKIVLEKKRLPQNESFLPSIDPRQLGHRNSLPRLHIGHKAALKHLEDPKDAYNNATFDH